VEKFESPEYRTIQGRHLRSTSTCFGVDARWGAEAPCEEPECEPTWPRKYAFGIFNGTPQPSTKLFETAQGLAYLHSRGVIHGDLKGVRLIIDPSTL
jgi:hypothetical protein